MSSRTINPNTLRVLYAHSGNQCAFPDCCLPIFEDNNQLTGECCHIEAFSKNGPRYNENLSVEERNGYDNLILLCARHHKIIDGEPETFPVDYLKGIKQHHEAKFSAENIKLTQDMMFQLQECSKRFWNEIAQIHKKDNTGLHRYLDPNLSINELMDTVEENFNQIEHIMEDFEHSDNNLMIDLKYLCKRLGWNFEKSDEIPYFENPFYNRNWDLHNLGRPNIINQARLYYLTTIVKLLEMLSLKELSINPILEKWKAKLLSFQQNNYYVD